LPVRYDPNLREGIVTTVTSWCSRRHITGVVAVATIAVASFAGGCVVAAQPHMQNALAALQSARAELQVAEANKGGHRVNAMRLVNEAINEVQAGIAAGS
jgi:hypothetical protein